MSDLTASMKIETMAINKNNLSDVSKEKLYIDTKTIFDDSRPCKRCGKYPTKEGYDACLGHIEGVTSICCGHGVSRDKILIVEDKI